MSFHATKRNIISSLPPRCVLGAGEANLFGLLVADGLFNKPSGNRDPFLKNWTWPSGNPNMAKNKVSK